MTTADTLTEGRQIFCHVMRWYQGRLLSFGYLTRLDSGGFLIWRYDGCYHPGTCAGWYEDMDCAIEKLRQMAF